jgi:hypothetical protein
VIGSKEQKHLIDNSFKEDNKMALTIKDVYEKYKHITIVEDKLLFTEPLYVCLYDCWQAIKAYNELPPQSTQCSDCGEPVLLEDILCTECFER